MAHIGIDARKIADFGIGTYIRNLVTELDRLAGDERYTLFAYADAELPALSGRFNVRRVRAANYSLREHLELPWRAREAQLDLYHAPHYVLPRLVPCPAVVTIHDLIHWLHPGDIGRPLGGLAARLLMRSAAKRARLVLTVSEASRRDIVSQLGVAAERVAAIANGVEDAFFAPASAEQVAAAARRWDLAGKTAVLVSGNIKPHKNLPRLLAAFARVARPRADFVLVVCGIAEASLEAAHAGSLASSLGIADRLRWLGRLEPADLALAYRAARVLAYPSLYEGFGLPVLEAMAAGTPVLTSKVSSLPEVAGDAALLVDPTSVEAIAAGLERLIADEELRRALIARGIERARGYTWRRTAEATLSCYRLVLGAVPALRERAGG